MTASSALLNNNFTGDTQDTIAGTYDTPNRELNPNQGRWISPDPAGMGAVDPTNPQTWNRYAYVSNNPLSRVDLTGLEMCDNDDCDDDGEGGDGGSGDGGNGGGSWGDSAGNTGGDLPSPLNVPSGPMPNIFQGYQPTLPDFNGVDYQVVNVTATTGNVPFIPIADVFSSASLGSDLGIAFATKTKKHKPNVVTAECLVNSEMQRVELTGAGGLHLIILPHWHLQWRSFRFHLEQRVAPRIVDVP